MATDYHVDLTRIWCNAIEHYTDKETLGHILREVESNLKYLAEQKKKQEASN